MKKLFLVLLTLSAAVSAFSIPLEELISPDKIRVLLAGERPTEIQFKDLSPHLIPNHSGLKQLLSRIQTELGPSVMVETLYLYKKPAGAGDWTRAEQADLYNQALALSTLAGLQYYSATRGSMRTFYETSTVIDSPSGKKPQGDPLYTVPPAELTIYARQKDLTFGENIYQYNYHVIPGAIVFIQQNLTSMTAGIIPAVGKNKLRSAVAVIDAGGYLLVYAASMAKAAALPGIRDRIGNSFSNRAEAILTWFSGQADKVFAQ
ncbi:DUF6675 family protein [Leadbettera azotonutricia]|uniref:Uncharacterized protein n=1 Tax=Leadbettera azotonutricia (strain ATCC BAA-888 / DSM 13862 / ZAS-9) TaxID=545695 RepID=F5Y9C3_LEAAZ|nr:DUF6675 family protein [Leadbettera azotonutricia]AEF80644.1 hypothetical protein TREAZ_2138 [Leadbettera azotonutricia ZAS-9]